MVQVTEFQKQENGQQNKPWKEESGLRRDSNLFRTFNNQFLKYDRSQVLAALGRGGTNLYWQ